MAAITVKGTQSLHKVVPKSQSTLTGYMISEDNEGVVYKINKGFDIVQQISTLAEQIFSPTPILSPEINSYIVCLYDKVLWVGIIEEICNENNDFYISFLHYIKNNNCYIFPEKKDSCWIMQEDIKYVLSNPQLIVSRRITYKFNEEDMNFLKTLSAKFC